MAVLRVLIRSTGERTFDHRKVMELCPLYTLAAVHEGYTMASLAFKAINAAVVPETAQHKPTTTTNAFHVRSAAPISLACIFKLAAAGKIIEMKMVMKAPTRLITTDKKGR